MNMKIFGERVKQTLKENGYTHQAVIDKEQYTRQHEAKQFEQLFLQCIK